MVITEGLEGDVDSKNAQALSSFPFTLAAGIPIPLLSSLLDIRSNLIILLLLKTPTK